MSFSRTQLRRLAAYVLLGWLFAFGVSVAHACGLMPGPADHRDGVAASAAIDQTPPADHPSCVKFCGDSGKSATGSGSVAASAPAHLDSVPLLQFRPYNAARPLCAAWTHDQGLRPPRDLPIELQRLTL
jgi:hypothetical protein